MGEVPLYLEHTLQRRYSESYRSFAVDGAAPTGAPAGDLMVELVPAGPPAGAPAGGEVGGAGAAGFLRCARVGSCAGREKR